MFHMPEGTLIDYKPRYNNKGYSVANQGCPNNPTMFAHDPAGYISGKSSGGNDAFKYAMGGPQPRVRY